MIDETNAKPGQWYVKRAAWMGGQVQIWKDAGAYVLMMHDADLAQQICDRWNAAEIQARRGWWAIPMHTNPQRFVVMSGVGQVSLGWFDGPSSAAILAAEAWQMEQEAAVGLTPPPDSGRTE